jgi:hypothetical protein
MIVVPVVSLKLQEYKNENAVFVGHRGTLSTTIGRSVSARFAISGSSELRQQCEISIPHASNYYYTKEQHNASLV